MQAVTPNKPDTKLPPLPVTVDTVIFTVLDHTLQVLLVKRREEKFAGLWSLPGGFVAEDESLETAALRELEEATGVRDVYLEQLYTFGDPGRDTRGRVVSVAYVALLAADRCPLIPNDLEAEARWWDGTQSWILTRIARSKRRSRSPFRIPDTISTLRSVLARS